MVNNRFINRKLCSEIKRLKAYFPVIVLTGPRQSGKTTLSKILFADFYYVDMMRATDRQIIEASPEVFQSVFLQGQIAA